MLEDPSSSSPSETSSPEESPRALKCVEWQRGGIRSLSHLCEGDAKSLCPATCWCPLGSACEHRDSFPSQKQPPDRPWGSERRAVGQELGSLGARRPVPPVRLGAQKCSDTLALLVTVTRVPTYGIPWGKNVGSMPT